MKNIIDFIDLFLNYEYEANKAKWDTLISDEDAIKSGLLPKQYFHSSLSYISFGRTEGLFDNQDYKIFAPVKMSRVTKRTLFQIKKYENSQFGDLIKRILIKNTIHLCFTGSDEKNDDGKSYYSRMYVVAETDEGIKIIYYFFFTKGVLDQMHDNVDGFIHDLGKLVGVYKNINPEEEKSLLHYTND
jgi:hypothetical protein